MYLLRVRVRGKQSAKYYVNNLEREEFIERTLDAIEHLEGLLKQEGEYEVREEIYIGIYSNATRTWMWARGEDGYGYARECDLSVRLMNDERRWLDRLELSEICDEILKSIQHLEERKIIKGVASQREERLRLWCKMMGYDELQRDNYTWWAIPPGGVIPVILDATAIEVWYKANFGNSQNEGL